MHIGRSIVLNDSWSWYQKIIEKLTFYLTFRLGTLCPMLTKLGTLCPGTLCPGTFWPGFSLNMSIVRHVSTHLTTRPVNTRVFFSRIDADTDEVVKEKRMWLVLKSIIIPSIGISDEMDIAIMGDNASLIVCNVNLTKINYKMRSIY